MRAILANEGDHVFILSLSGKLVRQNSSKAELRKSYLLLSSKVHPDKNPGSQEAKKAFQAVSESFERLANPEQLEEFEEEGNGRPPQKRRKKERFTRSNDGCYVTRIKCPRCSSDLKLEEDSAYNFLMQGIKQYTCGGCCLKFGCMTGLHYCPHCIKPFQYDPDDYHRKITCGNGNCDKEFGFMMFKVSERRELEIRRMVKEENEALAKNRDQKRQRAERANKRRGSLSNEEGDQEQLFILELRDSCPRCGHEMFGGNNGREEHLNNCNDQNKIEAHKKKVAAMELSAAEEQEKKEVQEDIQAFKTWEHNGRQVGQLWMLSVTTLRAECRKFQLDTEGHKLELISRLGRVIRERERKMLTMGPEHEKQISYDVTPIHRVDEEDLPFNLETLEREELACVAASYGLDFDQGKDVKVDIIKKLEKARNTGRGLLMITDERDGENESEEGEQDSDYHDSD